MTTAAKTTESGAIATVRFCRSGSRRCPAAVASSRVTSKTISAIAASAPRPECWANAAIVEIVLEVTVEISARLPIGYLHTMVAQPAQVSSSCGSRYPSREAAVCGPWGPGGVTAWASAYGAVGRHRGRLQPAGGYLLAGRWFSAEERAAACRARTALSGSPVVKWCRQSSVGCHIQMR